MFLNIFQSQINLFLTNYDGLIISAKKVDRSNDDSITPLGNVRISMFNREHIKQTEQSGLTLTLSIQRSTTKSLV